MTRRAHRAGLLAALLLIAGLGLCAGSGCGPSGPGLENKPPPKGGPPANTRRPPGEVETPQTR